MCIFGHKFGKIEEDGHQYCTRCGKAVHEHRWEHTARFEKAMVFYARIISNSLAFLRQFCYLISGGTNEHRNSEQADTGRQIQGSGG